MNYPEQQILKVLNRNFLSSPRYLINNLHIFGWESDYLAITKNGYAYEIEIKISVQDFKNDFKKVGKHRNLMHPERMEDGMAVVPNYLYYACPPQIVTEQMLPPYAGLMWVDTELRSIRIVKPAPVLHRMKFDVVGRKLVDKFYYNMQTWKKRALDKVYADPEQARKKGMVEGATVVRMSAINAFAQTCPYVDLSYGTDFPMCNSKELNHPMRDCILQCEKGREFKKLLK